MTIEAPDLAGVLFNRIGFQPYRTQEVILRAGKRFMMVAGGEQGGKSLTASKCLILHLPTDLAKSHENNEPVLYWLVADDYDGTRREFEYIVNDFIALFGEKNVTYTKVVNPGSIEVKVNGKDIAIKIETKSADNSKKLRMQAPYGIIGCEASTMDLDTYTRIMGRAAPRRAWVFLSGTFEEGSVGWYPQIFKSWRSGQDDRMSWSLPSTENLSLYPGGADDPELQRLKNESSDNWYMERIMGIPVPPKGLVFPEFNPDLHIRDVEYIPGETVYLMEDPGYGSNSAHALLFGQIFEEHSVKYMNVFDEIYERGIITTDIIDLAMTRQWWHEASKVLISDPNYKDAHHSMTSVAEIWMKEAGLYAFGTRDRINSGTERMKSFLKVDARLGHARLAIHPRCKGILSEFGAVPSPLDNEIRPYRWKTDNSGVIFGDNPKDEYNHAIKAVIYGLIEQFGHVDSNRGSEIKVTSYAKKKS